MRPKITKMSGPEIISGNLSQVTGTTGLLYSSVGLHCCKRAFEYKQFSLINKGTNFLSVDTIKSRCQAPSMSQRKK